MAKWTDDQEGTTTKVPRDLGKVSAYSVSLGPLCKTFIYMYI